MAAERHHHVEVRTGVGAAGQDARVAPELRAGLPRLVVVTHDRRVEARQQVVGQTRPPPARRSGRCPVRPRSHPASARGALCGGVAVRVADGRGAEIGPAAVRRLRTAGGQAPPDLGVAQGAGLLRERERHDGSPFRERVVEDAGQDVQAHARNVGQRERDDVCAVLAGVVRGGELAEALVLLAGPDAQQVPVEGSVRREGHRGHQLVLGRPEIGLDARDHLERRALVVADHPRELEELDPVRGPRRHRVAVMVVVRGRRATSRSRGRPRRVRRGAARPWPRSRRRWPRARRRRRPSRRAGSSSARPGSPR